MLQVRKDGGSRRAKRAHDEPTRPVQQVTVSSRRHATTYNRLCEWRRCRQHDCALFVFCCCCCHRDNTTVVVVVHIGVGGVGWIRDTYGPRSQRRSRWWEVDLWGKSHRRDPFTVTAVVRVAYCAGPACGRGQRRHRGVQGRPEEALCIGTRSYAPSAWRAAAKRRRCGAVSVFMMGVFVARSRYVCGGGKGWRWGKGHVGG
jgi:hypothetical protein